MVSGCVGLRLDVRARLWNDLGQYEIADSMLVSKDVQELWGSGFQLPARIGNVEPRREVGMLWEMGVICHRYKSNQG